jgi:hypothetical protein
MSRLIYNACEQPDKTVEAIELSLDRSILEDAAKARAHIKQTFGRELTDISEAA